MIWDSKIKSKDEAKRRLTLVLSYERKGHPPNFIDTPKEDLSFSNIFTSKSKSLNSH